MSYPLVLDIIYNVKKDQFTLGGDIKKGLEGDLIEEFLRRQIGAGEDKRKASEQDNYYIRIVLRLENDSITAFSDTGNKGLRDGILYRFLNSRED